MTPRRSRILAALSLLALAGGAAVILTGRDGGER